MKGRKLRITCFLVAFFVLSALLVASTAAADKVYKWKWYTPYNLAISPTMDQFPPIIEQKTNGRVRVTLYVGGQHPFKGPDMPQAIKTGACQMADVFGGYCVGIDPRLGASDLPFFSNSPEEEEALMAQVLKDVYNKLYNDFKMMPLASYPFPGQAILANVLFKNMDSLKGKKVRVFNKVTADMIKTLGGTPVTIPAVEIYTALQRGIVDGAVGSTFGHILLKNAEVAKYLTRTHAYALANTWIIVVSKDAFNQLPPDLQTKIYDAAAEYQAIARKNAHNTDAWAIKEATDKYGVTIATISPDFRQQIRKKMKKGCWEKWAKTFPGGMGLLAKMESFHEDWVKSH